jgi:methylmalonyl-CoA mutase C-terminal domain/subunit
MPRKIRVLVGKPGLDGHDRGAKVVAAALRDAGMEVIYTGLHQSPEQIVEAALQEDVDVVALSILSGAHMTLFPEVLALMKRRGLADRLLTGGGIIPPEDMETLARKGVGRLFGPGTSTQDIAAYIREWFSAHGGEDAAVATPEPRARSTVRASAAKPKAAAARASATKARPKAAKGKTSRRSAGAPLRQAKSKAARSARRASGKRARSR